MRVIARFNNQVTNHVVRLWAGHAPHMAVIDHVGRKSGQRYKTPVMVFVSGPTLWVVLNYGSRSDWVQNVLAAGHARVRYRGRSYSLDRPSVVMSSEVEALRGTRLDADKKVLRVILR